MTDLKLLVSKLNPCCRAMAEKAVSCAISRGNGEVDLEHLMLAMLDTQKSDARRIFRHFGLDQDRMRAQCNAAIDRIHTAPQTPSLSARLVKLLTASWAVASVTFEMTEIRSAALVLALAQSDDAAELTGRFSGEWLKLNAAVLTQKFGELLSPEEAPVNLPDASAKGEQAGPSALAQFTVDLTAAARAGALDPVFGRSQEIRLITDILTRRRQNNPILVGEPGVGKTAIVEGFALRIASGDIPPSLARTSVMTLDLGLLLAGASMRGEFESRLKGVMNEVQSSKNSIILFIDEAHMLIGGGGQADTANLLKPALARGDFRTIAATTHAEYRKYFEKDGALARRFQVVTVEEPGEQQAIQMLRPLVPILERHHGVRLMDDAITSAVRLSRRYIIGRQLPDKAVGILDTACANVAAAQNATPQPIETWQDRISFLEAEIRSLERERATGMDHAARLTELFDELAGAETQMADLEDRLVEERRLVRKSLELRATIDSSVPEEGHSLAIDELAAVTAELGAVQGESPLVPAFVDARVVAEVISGQTGIPVGRMLRSEIHSVLNLRSLLAERVVGQDHALETIARRVISARAGVDDPGRPTGVFLLVGPSGVGKTETALALADALYGGERNAVVLNMSEYQEAHSVSGLKGAPPGYVGYGEGGVLTEAVRRRPYCVLLLDEMEKAHADVMELFYQVFDKGVLEDSQGRVVDFRNTLILLTSNVATDLIHKVSTQDRKLLDSPRVQDALGTELRRVFKPAFLGRLVTIPYYSLRAVDLHNIAELKVQKIAQRLREAHGVRLEYSERLIEEITARCGETESGARNIDHILTGTLIPDVSERILCTLADERKIARMRVDVSPSGAFRYDAE
jgi:type VI secretion system protein VasG